MFGIFPSFWVPMASLNFSGSASIWLQSIQKRLADFDWDSFTTLLCTRFGRDRHQMLIQKFYTVKQAGSVSSYIEQFELIINHLSSYSDTIHTFYFLTRFVEGLRKDIRAVVLVQRPPAAYGVCLGITSRRSGGWAVQRAPASTRADAATLGSAAFTSTTTAPNSYVHGRRSARHGRS